MDSSAADRDGNAFQSWRVDARRCVILLGIVLLSGALSSCEIFRRAAPTLATAPTTVVMAVVTGSAADDVSLVSFPPGGGSLARPLLESGGFGPVPPPVFGDTTRIAPGIGANEDVYVVAHWGGEAGVADTLYFWVSENGREWRLAPLDFRRLPVGTLPPPSLRYSDEPRPSLQPFGPGVGATRLASRPAISFVSSRGDWFVALTHPATGQVQVLEFRLTTDQCEYPPQNVTIPDRCTRGTLNPALSYYFIAPTGGWEDTGAVSNTPPALAAVGGGELLLAFKSVGAAPSRVMSMRRQADRSWSAPSEALTADGSIIATQHAPGLSASPGEVVLAALVERGRSLDAVLFASGDGVAWNEQQRWPSGAGFANYPAAVAGPVSQRVVAIPGSQNTDVEYSVAGGSLQRLSVGANYGTSLAYGPGPVTVEDFSCPAGNALSIQPSGGAQISVALAPRVYAPFATDGRVGLTCLPQNARRDACSAATTHAVVRGENSTRLAIECWTRRPN